MTCKQHFYEQKSELDRKIPTHQNTISEKASFSIPAHPHEKPQLIYMNSEVSDEQEA